jgi:hypothetical protein
MKQSRFAPGVFMIAFCCTYAVAFWANRPLFLYYPLHSQFTWGPQPLQGVGPAMAWYGLLADAGIVALVLAVCLPQRLSDALLRYLWIFPAGAMLICVILLWHFFR